MKELTFVIGLPGSGKTTLINECYREDYRRKGLGELVTYEDWMRWDSLSDKEFNEDDRYDEIIHNLKHNPTYNHIFLTSVAFCKHEFLCKAEYYLMSNLPNLKINKIYFENNLKKSIANIIHRDILGGGKWVRNENGIPVYYGDHLAQTRTYEHIIGISKELSKNYIIPSKYQVHQMLDPNYMKNGPKTTEEYLKTSMEEFGEAK